MAKTDDKYLVIDRAYELAKWFAGHVGKFPRSHRYTLGARVEGKVYDVLDGLVRARYAQAPTRALILEEVNLDLQVLRFLGRLCHDMRFLPTKSHGYMAGEIDEIGRMAGGWKKALNKTK